MTRLIGHVLSDILEAIERVQDVTQDKGLAEFEENWQLQWIVQRAVQIVSEASRAIPDDLIARHPEIPWRNVRGIGNVLRHDYHALSDRLIWNIVIAEFPRLKAAVEDMRAQLQERR